MPEVSVIVPNFNHESFLPERLDSILAQTFRDFELIVLDDASTDRSREIIRSFKKKHPGIRVFLNERNSGNPFRQWDRGVAAAKGEFLWIAESDDAAAPDFLKTMVPVLRTNPNVGLVYCDALITDEKGNRMGSMSEYYSRSDKRRTSDYINGGRDEIERYLCVNNTINNASSVLFRKKDYTAAGFADSGMRFCGDWFLYLRILRTSDVAYVARPLNFFRTHAFSSWNSCYGDRRYLEEVMRIYRYILEAQHLPARAKKLVGRETARHFCLSVKRRHLPSKKAFSDMRKTAPFFAGKVLRFLAGHLWEKTARIVQGPRPAR